MITLEFNCPHCTHSFDDPYEVLDENRVIDIRCEACGKHFALAIMDCHRCGREEAFAWPTAPPPEALPRLTCTCGASFLASTGHEEDD